MADLEGGTSVVRRYRNRVAVILLSALVIGVVGVAVSVYAVSELGWVSSNLAVGEPSIPRRVGSPGLLATPVGLSPPGPSGILFSDGSGRLVTVGLSSDTYRVLNTRPADPGRTALLSFDGSRVALSEGSGIKIIDFVTGRQKDVDPPALRCDLLVPEGWLPDGSLIVMAQQYAKNPMTEGIVQRLGVLDTSSMKFEEFASATFTIASPGFAVAVGPRGDRIAYQYEQKVTVYSRRTATKTVFGIPPQSVLAGKGAWTPDGALITAARFSPQNDREWSLSFVDPATGRSVARDDVLSIRGPALIRLIGWDRQTSRPIVVAYDAPHAATWDLAREISLTVIPGEVTSVRVYELNPQGVGPTLITDVPDDVDGIDIASIALDSGRFRPGGSPRELTPLGLGLIGCMAFVAGIVGVVWAWRRRSSAGREAALVGGDSAGQGEPVG